MSLFLHVLLLELCLGPDIVDKENGNVCYQGEGIVKSVSLEEDQRDFSEKEWHRHEIGLAGRWSDQGPPSSPHCRVKASRPSVKLQPGGGTDSILK